MRIECPHKQLSRSRADVILNYGGSGLNDGKGCLGAQHKAVIPSIFCHYLVNLYLIGKVIDYFLFCNLIASLALHTLRFPLPEP